MCKDCENDGDETFADQGCIAFLVQHENDTEIGLMICKF
jgi:hypothetical protein